MPLKRLLLIFFIFASINIYAQHSNLIFNTNNTAHKFRLFINGNLKNSDFQTNVRLENIEAKNYRIKIVFENRAFGYIQKNIYVRPNTEKIYSFRRKRQNTGRRRTAHNNSTSVLRIDLLSEVPLYSIDDEYMGESNDANDAINYTTGACPDAKNLINTNYENYDVVIGTEKNNITIGTNGIKVNFDVNELINKVTNKNNNTQDNNTNDIELDVTEENWNNEPSSEIAIESNSCTPTFTNKQFALIIIRLEKEGFESKKLAIAKSIARSNCLLTKQVRDVIKLFNFENNRVAFAKFAYNNVADKENYDLLLDSFTFETSKQEIREYIK